MMDCLPVGSVVRIKDIGKRIVIAGVLQMEEDGDGTMHDYLGHPYPEGYLGPGMNFLFDAEDIEEVVFRGYEDEEREGFLQFLDLMLAAQAEGINLASIALGAAANDVAEMLIADDEESVDYDAAAEDESTDDEPVDDEPNAEENEGQDNKPAVEMDVELH